MPRESTPNEEGKEGSRVTRSLRKRLNSTDVEDSPSIQTPKAVAAKKNMNSINEEDAEDNNSGATTPLSESREELSVRKTRARASSTLTEENVTAMNNTPARRLTRRSSGSLEPSAVVLTPSRRSTRRTSVTSDDTASVNSSTLVTRSRRTIVNIAQTVPEEEEIPATPSKSPIPEVAVAAESKVDEIPPTPSKTPTRMNPNLSLKNNLTTTEDVQQSGQSPGLPAAGAPKQETPLKNESTSLIVPDGDLSGSAVKQETPVNISKTLTNESGKLTNALLDNEKETNTTVLNISSESDSGPVPVAIYKSPMSTNTPLKEFSIRLDRMSNDITPNKQMLSFGFVKKEELSDVAGSDTNQSPQSTSRLIDLNKSNDSGANNADTAVQSPANGSMNIDSNSQTNLDKTCASIADYTEIAEGNNSPAANRSTNRISLGLRRQSVHETKDASDAGVTENEPDELDTSLKTVELLSSSGSFLVANVSNSGSVGDPTANNKSQRNSTTSKSVTFAEELNDSAKSEEVFHDTREDLSDDIDDENNDDAMRCIGAGVTPMRKPLIRSMQSSTPLVMPPAAAEKKPPQTCELNNKKKRQTIHAVGHEKRELETDVDAPLSRSWSQAVRGRNTSIIDRSSLKKSQEEEVIKAPVRKAQLQDFDDDDEEDSCSDAASHNSFVNDEAEEAGEDENSMSSEERRYIEEHQVPEDGVSIGSEDSAREEVDDDEEGDEEMGSFIVSDTEMEEEHLLDGTGDDLMDAVASDTDVKKPKRTILRIHDTSSDEDEELANADVTVVHDEQEDTAQNNLSVHETDEDQEQSEKMQANSSTQTNESFTVTEKQTNQLLSTSVYQIKEKTSKAKHNKSLNEASNVSFNLSFSSYAQQNKEADKSENSATDEVAEKIAVAATAIEEPVAANDVETKSPPKTKTPKMKKAIKPDPPSYDAILSRCENLLAQANEARRLEKLQNRKPVSEEVVEKLKSKKEFKQLEKARRAAALLTQQEEEAARQKRKAEKKLARKLADPVIAIPQALAHRVDVLAKCNPAPAVVVAKHEHDDTKSDNVVTESEQVPTKKVHKVQNAPELIEDAPKTKKKSKKTIPPVVVVKHQKPIISEAITPIVDAEPNSKKSSKQKLHQKPQAIVVPTTTTAAPKKNPHVHQAPPTASLQPAKKRTPENVATNLPKPIPKPPQKLKESHGNSSDALPTKPKKKKLNILTKSSTALLNAAADPEPIRPAKPKKPEHYNVLQVRSTALPANDQSKGSANNRKRLRDEAKKPAKPQWTSAGEFLVSKILPIETENSLLHVAGGGGGGGTDFVVTSLSKKRKLKAKELVGAVAAKAISIGEFREKATNSERIKREPTAQLLQQKKKMHAYTRF